MFYKLMESIVKEDTFGLFTDPVTGGLSRIFSRMSTINNVHDLRASLTDYFKEVISNSMDEDLEYYEGFKMLKFIENIFEGVAEEREGPSDPTDDMIEMYCESLKYFSDNVKVDIVKKNVDDLLSYN